MGDTSASQPVPSLNHGRWCIVAAAVLWSSSGFFGKLLTRTTFLEVNDPPILPLQIAFYRVLFAGLVLLPTLRRRDISFKRMMIVMAACFAIMNALFVSALTLGTAANAILLQYTAPMWMYLASIWWLGERADRRGTIALALGMIGIAVIVGGGWQDSQLPIVAVALGSGLAYAGVVICLRVLRGASSRWLTILNHLVGAVILVPFASLLTTTAPTARQFFVLFVFGAVQMGLAYWLIARGLRSVSPQEAGTITLLEPLLNPLWAYLVSPETETPTPFTLIGGGFILGALLWRYWPDRRPHAPREDASRGA